MDKKWIRQEKGFVASEGERLRVLGDLGMHPGYSAVEGGLKAPKGPLSIFTQPESAKVFGIGHTTNPVDHAAMKVIHLLTYPDLALVLALLVSTSPFSHMTCHHH